MSILVSSPFPPNAQLGNSVSARRIADILDSELRLPTRVACGDDGLPATLLIALNARRSREAIRSFATRLPETPIVVLLPGSDIHETEIDPAIKETMDLAQAIVIAQEASHEAVPQRYHHLLHLVPKSLSSPLPNRCIPSEDAPFEILLASHLRPQKDPLLAVDALDLLPASSTIHLHHYGEGFDEELASQAEDATASNARYTWHGAKAPDKVLHHLAGAHLALNTSCVEGGANAICEAIHLGVPTLATHIPGNIGMLGPDHPGYFPPGDAKALAHLLSKAETTPTFLQKLTDSTSARAAHFTREAETAAWKTVIDPLLEHR